MAYSYEEKVKAVHPLSIASALLCAEKGWLADMNFHM